MMQRTFTLGRIAGIEVGLNWTWLIIFVLIGASLGAAVFPAQNPGLDDATYALMAVVAASLFFASILLHELGHAIVARREGVEIEGITLWLFGGVARFKSMYGSPGAEFRIAAAGPLVTLAIAALLLAAASALSLPSAVDGVVFWLGYINVLLLLFNMLPAVPLDGGRILHSALWRMRGELLWATRVAAGIGIAFGYLMVGGGLALLLLTPFLAGLWLALIGWFLTVVARAEAEQVAAREALGGSRVEDLMTSDPVSVEPGMSLGAFIDDVAGHTSHTSYPVVEGGRPVGLVRFQDVVRQPRAGWDHRTVSDCMLRLDDIVTTGVDGDASQMFTELLGEPPHRALVLDADGRLAGILSVRDLARRIQIELGGGGPEVDRGP